MITLQQCYCYYCYCYWKLCEYEIVIFEFTVNERLGLKEDQGATVFGEGVPGSQKLQKDLLLENHEI